MAVFLLNICKFDGCGITFPTLMDLIEHIESTHIDYDPKVVEQKEQAQPTCLPLSYVLRFIDATRKENQFISTGGSVDLKRKLAIKHHSYSLSSSNRSNTPTGSELDEDEMMVSESEDSNDSWTTEEFSSEFIMRYGSRHSVSTSGTPGNEKPFACPVPGCKKRYKNVNGIKYHSKNGHKKDGKVRKGYKCHCGKSYKTAQGLKSHALSSHSSVSETVVNSNISNNTNNNITTSSNMNSINSSQNGRTSPSQSIGSSSPSSVSNLSGSCSLSSNGGGTLSLNTVNQGQQTSMSQISSQSVNSLTSCQNNIVTTAAIINHNSATFSSSNIASNILKGNLGLISIKTTSGKPTSTTNLIAANKILKLTATIASSSANCIAQNDINKTCILENSKVKFELNTSGNSMLNNNLNSNSKTNVNVSSGIINNTNNSTNNSNNNNNNNNNSCSTINNNDKSNSNNNNNKNNIVIINENINKNNNTNSNNKNNENNIVNNDNNNYSNKNQGNHFDNLPLTPLSPNLQQQNITKTLTNNSIGSTTILGTNNNGITLLTTSASVLGGVLNEKSNGDDT